MNGETQTMRKRLKRGQADVHTFVRDLERVLSTQYSSTQVSNVIEVEQVDGHSSLLQGSHFDMGTTGVNAISTAEQNLQNFPITISGMDANSTMNVPWDDAKQVAPAEPEMFTGLPPMELIAEGLDSVDNETLRQSIYPIWKSLESMDAIHMLDLKRVEQGQGARVSDGVFCQPIHDQVSPVRNRRGSCVRYVHVSEVPNKYSVGIFVFPPHARIPLHDHPGMCVLSRVLYGDLERISLDLVRETQEAPSSSSWFHPWSRKKQLLPHGSRQAYLNGKEHLEAPDVAVLYPYEGNLHEFIAGPNGAAVLDVLLPPYDEGHERECTFYQISDEQVIKGPCWIVPIDQPEDFHCLSGRYGDLGYGDDTED